MIPRMKSALMTSLTALEEECLLPNWDGYGAEAVSPLALKCAEDVIASLPDDLPLPECSIEPDGFSRTPCTKKGFPGFPLDVFART